MTEQEWLASSDPVAMLAHIGPTASPRKLRLFAVSCCRAVWDGKRCRTCCGWGHYYPDGATGQRDCPDCRGTGRVGGLTDERSRRAVEVAERYADGLATAHDMWEAHRQAELALAHRARHSPGTGHADLLACHVAIPTGRGPELGTYFSRQEGPPPPAAQAALLRCIFANPFKPVTVRPEWLRWNDGTVRRIAEGIYQDRAFDRMGILHDALLDSGCDDDSILDHCKENIHARGCFLLDAIGGKC